MFRMNCVDDTIWLVGLGRTCASGVSTKHAGLLSQASDAIHINILSINTEAYLCRDGYKHCKRSYSGGGFSNGNVQ